ncbi:hypothetical protein W97_02141 [Coniosporium apollinis CBS 100218]|uniref:Uncharacterized protein n=1 Tax=Coniosporium apollinis (strain CBS 100218) TaxID=1168221 RepID=R7YLX3_CONA1|nr:uncharacterized protein W97_02141 [Coniosporium apollinis CBS 100218]EON62915.1 hypothetical protein W97_02141 [Coniosporium apollinis CBS 100218]
MTREDIIVGSIVNLPFCQLIDPSSLVFKRSRPLHADAFGHPMVVAEIRGDNVLAFPITSFRGTAILEKFPKDQARRLQYLAIEHTRTQASHDGTPVLAFTDKRSKMLKLSYVNTIEAIEIEIGNLDFFTNMRHGGEHRLTREAVRIIQSWTSSGRTVGPQGRWTPTPPAPLVRTQISQAASGLDRRETERTPLAGNSQGKYVAPYQRAARRVSGTVSCRA